MYARILTLPSSLFPLPSLSVIIKCQEIIQNGLSKYGLELKPSKTKISHTLKEHEENIGFDFLGFTIGQFPVGKNHSGKSTKVEKLGFKTRIKPSKDGEREDILIKINLG
jgi:RNA-directed DNA polymerase